MKAYSYLLFLALSTPLLLEASIVSSAATGERRLSSKGGSKGDSSRKTPPKLPKGCTAINAFVKRKEIAEVQKEEQGTPRTITINGAPIYSQDSNKEIGQLFEYDVFPFQGSQKASQTCVGTSNFFLDEGLIIAQGTCGGNDFVRPSLPISGGDGAYTCQTGYVDAYYRGKNKIYVQFALCGDSPCSQLETE